MGLSSMGLSSREHQQAGWICVLIRRYVKSDPKQCICLHHMHSWGWDQWVTVWTAPECCLQPDDCPKTGFRDKFKRLAGSVGTAAGLS